MGVFHKDRESCNLHCVLTSPTKELWQGDCQTQKLGSVEGNAVRMLSMATVVGVILYICALRFRYKL